MNSTRQTWPHLPRAPITEALVDLRVELPPEVNLATLAQFRDLAADRYPNRRERHAFQVEIKAGNEPRVHDAKSAIDGYLFTSADGSQVVQARLDGFTFSRLKPYQDWDRLRSEAHEWWERYTELTRPQAIIRIAVRYINRIEIPLPMNDFRDWLQTMPEVSRSLPQNLSELFMRVVLSFDEAHAVAIVTEAVARPEDNKTCPLILDIDVFRQERFAPDAPAVWHAFEALHEVKNRIFFESLTDRTLELFR